jgi:superfamily II DNA/RNA helicase
VTATFRDLGVDDALCDALEAKGITHPFPIQAMTLPMALSGADLIGQARTGTGKTLAFGLPLLQRIDTSARHTQALVVVPTRELCVQVHDDLRIGAALGITTISVYGGTPYEEQTAALEGGVHVVVGTPGRLLDHLNRGSLDLSKVRALVLDEADEMLDMGFLPDVERLIEGCPTDRHTMLFSATMPTAIVRMARRYMISPTFTRADLTEGETAPNVDQHFMLVHRMDKPRLLARLLQTPERGNVYVFVRTKHMADRLVEELGELGSEAIAIHGDLRQTTRERNLDRFREGKVSVLVATEVAARGLDVENVTHVVNYDCPEDEKMYLHRIGRTARAGRAGVAVTFVEHNEMERANLIRRAIDRTDIEVRETFSTSPDLTELFDLPSEVPWARSVARRRAPDEGDGGRGGRGGRDGGRGGRGGGRDGGREGGRAEKRDGGRDGRDGGKRESGRAEKRDAERETKRDAEPHSEERSTEREEQPRERGRERRRDDRPRDDASRDDAPRDDATEDGATRSDATGDGEDGATRPSRRRRGGRGRRRGGRGEAGASDSMQDSGSDEPRPERRDDDRDEQRGGEARDEQGGEQREGSGRGRRRGGRGRDGSRRESGREGGREAGERSERRERSEPSTRSNAPTQRDTSSRGEGQPQLARRVKVEHLP